PRPRDGGVRLGAEPARAHLVRRVRRAVVWRRLEPPEEGVEILALSPADVVPVEGDDLARAAGTVEQRQLGVGARGAGAVERIGELPADDRLALRSEDDLACARV